jgi:hypothetical protein
MKNWVMGRYVVDGSVITWSQERPAGLRAPWSRSHYTEVLLRVRRPSALSSILEPIIGPADRCQAPKPALVL